MTIQGAIYELNNMLSSNDIPCYWKPAIKKIIETVEQNVGEISEQTNGDLISKSALDQIKWERDVAIEQLKDLGYELGEKPREEKTAEQPYGWCKGCKEYDTEKHCCHRYSSFIRESLQDSINAVLEDIKTEIEQVTIFGNAYQPIEHGLLMSIIDKHISGKEE